MDVDGQSPPLNILVVGFVYFGFFAFATAMHMEEGIFQFPPMGPHFWFDVGKDLLIGCAVAVPIVVGTHFSIRFFTTMKELAHDFAQLIGPLSSRDLFFLSIFSAFGEEFFFRGFIQGKVGLLFASIVFGLLHIGPTRRFLIWTLFATVIGFLLGILYQWRGDLLTPVIAHFLINLFNLRALQKLDASARLS